MRKSNPFEIVFVLVLLVLVTFVVGNTLGRKRNPGDWRSDCLRNLMQLGLALKQYSQDYDERYPWRLGIEEPDKAWLDLGMLLPNYCSAMKYFQCPSARDRPWDRAKTEDRISNRPLEPFVSTNTTEVISYAYGIDARTDSPTAWTEDARSTVRLLADKKAGVRADERSNHKDDGRNVLYHDGHVKWKPGADPLDPDEEDGVLGLPGSGSYRQWWSDPPYFGE